jgi:hypothetical protein
LSLLNDIDILTIVKEYSGSINNTKTFSNRYLPDTRNLRNKDIRMPGTSFKEIETYISNFRTKDLIWLLVLVIIIFIILKIF